ncbi:Chromo (CHRromatin Organization MOdifier) domain [Carpediemonas membranifera]|uniref:Chromo (CHRromatin Organization MOdifier) domain n=1 Tax=Carpediemonas membranifera TaxID=201153 RepID=A0A8J6DYB8_9EUKA|nr:Chromo (CHRromatin Organization MOdifier) domain [Carpediemonas membranifera]|eukprot:KAG9391929.1 Chromo (CHRromatin Organization MOdifier) domain [Carpediemonas membranifera]
MGISPQGLKRMARAYDRVTSLTAFAEALTRTRRLCKSAIDEYDAVHRRRQPAPQAACWKRGDLCFVIPPRKPKKLAPFLRGPLKLTGPGESPNTYLLKDLVSGSVTLIHQERMIAAKGIDDQTALAMAATDHDEYEVEAIVDHDLSSKPPQILIRWKGFEPSEDSWEPLNAANRQLRVIDEYLASLPAEERRKLSKKL